MRHGRRLEEARTMSPGTTTCPVAEETFHSIEGTSDAVKVCERYGGIEMAPEPMINTEHHIEVHENSYNAPTPEQQFDDIGIWDNDEEF